MTGQPRPERRADEAEADFAARLMAWHKQRNAAKRIVQAQAQKILEPTASPVIHSGQAAASDFASQQSIEAARVRDIAARRREPRIENMDEG